MILAKARVIDGSSKGTLRIGLTFPTGFDPDEVIKDSVRVNGDEAPEAVSVRPRRGTLNDIYREFEVSIAGKDLDAEKSPVQISGRMKRGLTFTATVHRPSVAVTTSPDGTADH